MNKFKKALALPFVIITLPLVLLYWSFFAISYALIYPISFLLTIKYFIIRGEWRWSLILQETYDDLWWR